MPKGREEDDADDLEANCENWGAITHLHRFPDGVAIFPAKIALRVGQSLLMRCVDVTTTFLLGKGTCMGYPVQ